MMNKTPVRIDANLINGWGISFPTPGPARVLPEDAGKNSHQHGVPIEIEELWGIAFAPSTSTTKN